MERPDMNKKKRKHWTDRQREYIRHTLEKMHTEYTTQQVADYIGISYLSLKHVSEHFGMPRCKHAANNKYKLTDEQKQYFYQSKTNAEIAKLTGAPESYIKNYRWKYYPETYTTKAERSWYLPDGVKKRLQNYDIVCMRDWDKGAGDGVLCFRKNLEGEDNFSVENMYIGY